MQTEFPRWCVKAFEEMLYGVREVPGLHHNARILEYHSRTALRATDDETPWCAAFVSFCLQESRIMSTNRANARSYLEWGNRCDARLGGIVVLWRHRPSSWQGHVGFLVGEGPGTIKVLGGNQGNAVSIADYPADRILAYRWPREEDVITTGGLTS